MVDPGTQRSRPISGARFRGNRIATIAAAATALVGLSAMFSPAQAASTAHATDGIQGRDISVNQGTNYDWQGVAEAGVKFGQAQATDGLDWTSPAFRQQYKAIGDAGMYKGAYHFARPHQSGGAEQAQHFVKNGGGWTADGKTLPGMLDLEPTPSAKTAEEQCYHQSKAQMIRWIDDFRTEYQAETGRLPMIYTTTAWWNQCVGDTPEFADSPLMIAQWGSKTSGQVPQAWGDYDFWQHTEGGAGKSSVADRSRFNASSEKLADLASNPQYVPVGRANAQAYLGY
ncbi:GH25 family lysozyme [Kocuria massiliensis]|uniref:GH25 family lysozyme n=1 Tax=Kocuria massiliensis TaxID=1926282 RepID=UPI000A1CAF9D|nr:GH25 family lysozyme [Kocuria massiliensis]